jgi:hypothetical protein
MISQKSAIATLRPDLGGSMMEFDLEADRAGFIAHRVLPVLDVDLAGDTIPKIKLESLLQNRDTSRKPGTGYNRGDWEFDKDSYSTEEQGAEEPVDENTKRKYRHLFDAEMVCTNRAVDAVMRNAEKRVADLVFNATTWTGAALTTAVTKEWSKSNLTTATPIADVNAARNKVWEGTGLWPNALILNKRVFNNLRTLDEIKEAIQSAGSGYPTRARDITAQQLAEVFDLDYILVAGGAKNTANEAQARSIASIWSDEYAMVTRICTTNDIQEPGLGRTFHWIEDGSEIDGLVEMYWEERVRSDIVRARHQVHEKLLYAACGHLLSNITE